MAAGILENFLAGDAKACGLFENNFQDQQSRIDRTKKAAQKLTNPDLIAELTRYNSFSHPAVEKNFQRLISGGVAVAITGQQVGVLGGPLMTVSKIVSTIKVAQQLEQESGVPVVPMFWMQTEDHDFEEISTASFVRKSSVVDFTLKLPENEVGDSVGSLHVTEEFSQKLKQLLAALPGSNTEIADSLVSAYSEGETLGTAFWKFMQPLFAEYGVLFFDGNNSLTKQLYSDFIASSILRSKKIGESLERRDKQLEEIGYSSQVKVRQDSPLFFLSVSGKRLRLLEQPDGMYRAGAETISKEALFKILEEEPWRFTTSALIRPVFQDSIFPTAAYIAGPAEFNYHAQITELYPFFHASQPLIIPRDSYMVLSKGTTELYEKQGGDLEYFREEPFEWFLQIRERDSHHPDVLFESISKKVVAALSELEARFDEFDPGLQKSLNQTTESTERNLGKLKGKYWRALFQKEREVVSDYEQARLEILPRGVPQERLIAGTQFLLEAGSGIIKEMLEKSSPFAPSGVKVIAR